MLKSKLCAVMRQWIPRVGTASSAFAPGSVARFSANALATKQHCDMRLEATRATSGKSTANAAAVCSSMRSGIAAAIALTCGFGMSIACCDAAVSTASDDNPVRQHAYDELFEAQYGNKVAGQTALITGASAGIGKATACAFAAAGINLVLVARREDKLLEIKAEVERRGLPVSVTCIAGDCCADAVYDKLRELKLIDKIDIVVANAGCALGKDAIENANVDDWRGMMDVNCMGTFRMIREVLPSMVARKAGTIIATGSIAGIEPYEGGSVYCASKFATHAFMKALRYETYAHGIRVAVVAPGAVGEGTEFSKVRFKGDADKVVKTYDRMKELKATDVAAQARLRKQRRPTTMLWVVKQPAHVCLDMVLMLPTCQAGSTRIHRS